MDVTAQMVMALRGKTGLSMMECKKALVESGGDENKAMEWLRKRGLAKAGEMTERAASEGRVAVYIDAASGRAGMVELRCETEPVASTPDFIKLANACAQVAAGLDNPTPEQVLDSPMPGGDGRKVRELWDEVFNRVRENLQLARVGSIKGSIGHYVHHNAKVGVLVDMSAPCRDDAKADVCMHIAAMRPPYVHREEVPASLIAEQRERAAEQVKGKPANIIDKIIDGKLNTWFAEIVLHEQPFAKDDKKTVGQFLGGVQPGLKVNRFLRYQVGTK